MGTFTVHVINLIVDRFVDRCRLRTLRMWELYIAVDGWIALNRVVTSKDTVSLICLNQWSGVKRIPQQIAIYPVDSAIQFLNNRGPPGRGQNAFAWPKCVRTITFVFCRDLHLTSMFSSLLQKDLLKVRWSLVERFTRIIIVPLVTQGLSSSFLSRPVG